MQSGGPKSPLAGAAAAASLMRLFGQRTGLLAPGPQGAPRSPPPSPPPPPSLSVAEPTVAQREPPRRYLWTDAFAVCNCIGLAAAAEAASGSAGGAAGSAQSTGAAGSVGSSEAEFWRRMSLVTIEHVHAVLARHRADDPQRRSGWLAAAAGAADRAHPTRAGLRIGKKLPDLPGGEASTAADEWHRDGQVRKRQPDTPCSQQPVGHEPTSQPSDSKPAIDQPSSSCFQVRHSQLRASVQV